MASGGRVWLAKSLLTVRSWGDVVFTGESGAFRLDNVPVGTYNVVIETPGQPATTLPGVAVSAGEATDTGTATVVDLSSNAQHCGACGNTCLGGPNTTGSCVNGTCQAQGCALGWATEFLHGGGDLRCRPVHGRTDRTDAVHYRCPMPSDLILRLRARDLPSRRDRRHAVHTRRPVLDRHQQRTAPGQRSPVVRPIWQIISGDATRTDQLPERLR